MFSCPSRESMEEPLSAHELLIAADQQLEACNGEVAEVMAVVCERGTRSHGCDGVSRYPMGDNGGVIAVAAALCVCMCVCVCVYFLGEVSPLN